MYILEGLLKSAAQPATELNHIDKSYQAGVIATALFTSHMSDKERVAKLNDERTGPDLQRAIEAMTRVLLQADLNMEDPNVTKCMQNIALAHGTDVQHCMLSSLAQQASNQYSLVNANGNDPETKANDASWITDSTLGQRFYGALSQNKTWKLAQDPIVGAFIPRDKMVNTMKEMLRNPMANIVTSHSILGGGIEAARQLGTNVFNTFTGQPTVQAENPYASFAGYQHDPNNISNSGMLSGGVGGLLAMAPMALMSKNPLMIMALGGLLGGGYQYGRHAGWWNGYEPVNNLLDSGGRWIGNNWEGINENPWFERNEEDQQNDMIYGKKEERQQANTTTTPVNPTTTPVNPTTTPVNPTTTSSITTSTAPIEQSDNSSESKPDDIDVNAFDNFAKSDTPKPVGPTVRRTAPFKPALTDAPQLV